MRARWKIGLIRIWCSRCGRHLDWAERAFLAAHPEPVCGPCCVVAAQVAAEQETRRVELAEMGQVTAEALFRLSRQPLKLDDHHSFVVDSEVPR